MVACHGSKNQNPVSKRCFVKTESGYRYSIKTAQQIGALCLEIAYIVCSRSPKAVNSKTPWIPLSISVQSCIHSVKNLVRHLNRRSREQAQQFKASNFDVVLSVGSFAAEQLREVDA